MAADEANRNSPNIPLPLRSSPPSSITVAMGATRCELGCSLAQGVAIFYVGGHVFTSENRPLPLYAGEHFCTAMVAHPILPDVFESWVERQKEKPVKAKSGFIAEKKI
jgi:hypothetical protein